MKIVFGILMGRIFSAMSLEEAKKCRLKVKVPWLLFCCAPSLRFLLAILFLKLNPFHCVPLWSDEIWWYSQINAVIHYGRLNNFYSMVPAGFGQNCIFNGRPASKSKYIIADKRTKMVFKGYRNIYSDELISIFEKKPMEKEKGG